jgi:hypothetical protein
LLSVQSTRSKLTFQTPPAEELRVQVIARCYKKNLLLRFSVGEEQQIASFELLGRICLDIISTNPVLLGKWRTVGDEFFRA